MTSINVQFIKKSSNAKTGKIPVTNSDRNSCPPACPLIENGCYAHAGYYTRLNWDKVTSGERGGNWSQLCDSIKALPNGQVWRHNVSGDLPMVEVSQSDLNKALAALKQAVIDKIAVSKLVDANKGKRGFTYSHHDMSIAANRETIAAANQHGFTINLSGNNAEHADQLHKLGIAPVVAIVPADQLDNFTTQAGNKVVICPAVVRDDVSCATCKMCAIPDRKTIIGFPAHGAQKGRIEV